MKTWFFKHPNTLKFFINVYPPLFFSGIKVISIDPDFHRCRVKLKNWPSTRNANGTQFGGSLFSMSDCVFGMMLLAILGVDKYYVWDKKSKIIFKNPGIGTVYLECQISNHLVTEIIANTQNGNKYFPTVTGTVYDKKGNEVATIQRTLYVRLKPEYRKQKKVNNNTDDNLVHTTNPVREDR
ncbi:MAG: DUF4442 domain-containing protein [Neisseriaceae bacterium]|nr:MAG: DUF4442 domain-containing protein [Neisseriaceae bacterium]